MNNIDIFKNHLSRELDGKSGQQYKMATTRTDKTGFRRVKGPAGTGKSLALVARAAMLRLEGKNVLVTCYNKTLPNFLRRLFESHFKQYSNGNIVGEIKFINFHSWCRRVCTSSGLLEKYEELKRNYDNDEFWGNKLPELVSDIYFNKQGNPLLYDAILVDEGQDFKVSWWTTLKKAVVENGEMLLVADKTQNVYGRAHVWTEETMKGLDCGFSGDWFSLPENSYRLPETIIPILRDFLVEYPTTGEKDPPSSIGTKHNLFDKYRWVQLPQGISVVESCIKAIEELRNNPDIPTVYFILKRKNIGKRIAEALREALRERDCNIYETYSHDSRKSDFQEGRAEICMTTIHSFKGWETSHIVVYIDDIGSERDNALFYTALSRLKKHQQGCALTVVCSCQELEKFGRKHFTDFDVLSSSGSVSF